MDGPSDHTWCSRCARADVLCPCGVSLWCQGAGHGLGQWQSTGCCGAVGVLLSHWGIAPASPGPGACIGGWRRVGATEVHLQHNDSSLSLIVGVVVHHSSSYYDATCSFILHNRCLVVVSETQLVDFFLPCRHRHIATTSTHGRSPGKVYEVYGTGIFHRL